MKKARILVLFLIILTLMGCTDEKNEVEFDWDQIETKVEGNGDIQLEQLEPGMDIEEMNEIIGFEADLLGALKVEEIQYETYRWQLNQEASIGADFENGQAVLIGGWNSKDGYSEQKKLIESTPESTVDTETEILAEEDVPSVLPTITVGTNEYGEGLGSSESFAAEILREILNFKGYEILFKSYPSSLEEEAALRSGEIDILVDLEANGQFLYSTSYDSVHTSDLVYGLSSNNAALLEEINTGISSLKSSGKYKELFINYYGEENYVGE